MSNYAEFWWSWRRPESTERIPMHTCLPRQQFAAQKILQRFLAASGLQVGSIGPILGRFAMQTIIRESDMRLAIKLMARGNAAEVWASSGE
jgi:hypothetical protein